MDMVFLSSFRKILLHLQGSSLELSLAYHPSTDSQTEALNKCVEGYLRHYAREKLRVWSQWLNLAE